MDRAAIQERFGIVGSSAALQNVIDRARQVARTDITVLIEGESGVGKELIADLVHQLSPRRHGSFIVVNCGAIPEGLIESELFGAEKGAYTGATEKRKGYFEEGNGGTIFLDEIGEMPLAAQVRLLRVLESGEFSRVGSSTTHKTDVRVIAATNKDLGREVQAGRFREDLYYRLSTVLIKLPPVRDRKEDILPLFERFAHQFAQRYNSSVSPLSDEAQQLLLRYRWPGNVREIRNVAEQVVVLHRGGTVSAEEIRPYLRGVTAADGVGGALLPVTRGPVGDRDGARERELIYRALVEIQLEMRELKEQVGTLVTHLRATPREVHKVYEGPDFREERGDYVILGEPERDAYASFIEDVAFEIEGDEIPSPSTGAPKDLQPPVAPPHEEVIPTLEDVERELIMRALDHFDGNRRQTAKALGISERTLYRKLKDLEDES